MSDRRANEVRAAIVKPTHENPKVTVTKPAEILSTSATAVEKGIRYLKSEVFVR